MGDSSNTNRSLTEEEIQQQMAELGIINSNANESVRSSEFGSEPPNSSASESLRSSEFGSEPPNSNTSEGESVRSSEFGSTPSSSETTNTPTGANDSGVVVQQGEEQALEEEEPFFLGDRIVIKSTEYGMTQGVVYFLNEEILRIQPDGANKLVDFSFDDGAFDESLGVQGWNSEKGPRTSFVEFQQFRKDQLIDGYSEGKLVALYKILDVNEERDAIQVMPMEKTEGGLEELGDERWIVFDFIGIPLEEEVDVLQPTVIPEREQSLSIEELTNEAAVAEAAAAPAEETTEELITNYEVLGELPETPPALVLADIPESERFIPEDAQMSDMFSDLLSDIPIASRRSYMSLRRTRIFVESASLLKNSVIAYREDGTIQGEQPLSLTSLSDTLSNRTIPLVRPVLATRRVLVNGVGENFTDTTTEQFRMIPILQLITGFNEFTEQYPFATSEKEAGLPRWYQYWQRIYKQYPMGDEFTATGYSFQTDGEFFRWDIPGEEIDGLTATHEKKPNSMKDKMGFFYKDMSTFVTQITQSLRRGLGPTYRAGSKGVELAFSSDKGPLKTYILFPYTLAQQGFLGSIRTGRLWDDVLRSSAQKQWMSQILSAYGGVTEDPDAQKILALHADSATLANISFKDYLQMLLSNIVLRGLGDISGLIADLAVADKEFNTEQMTIIQERILQVLASVRKAIATLRESAEAPKFTAHLLNDFSFTQFMLDGLKETEGLQDVYKEFTKRIPKYANNDIGIFGFFMATIPDYFLAMLGGDPERKYNENVRYKRLMFLNRAKDMYALQRLRRMESKKPAINPCPHVKQYHLIQKTKHTPDRMRLLNKFFRDYKSNDEEENGNWFDCRKCDQHLMCRHEVLQIQQVLKPQEYDVIQKEIILTFAGGRYGSMYICRNCGKPISEVDYDKNVEFDDEGRPMMGRSVLVDQDAAETEELKLILNLPVQTVEETIKFETKEKTELYDILKEIVKRIGIQPEKSEIVTLVDTAALYAGKILTQEAYQKRLGDKKKGDYQAYRGRSMVSLVAGLFLIHIQTKIPDYSPRSFAEGCRPGFLGWPLLEVAATSEEELRKEMSVESNTSIGVRYMACVLASIAVQRPPWTTTKWLSEKKSETRIQKIVDDIVKYIDKNLMTNADIQTALEKKRTYLEEQFGKDAMRAKHSEKLPKNFLPHMGPFEEVVVAEGAAQNERGAFVRSVAWIRALHAFARERTKIVANSPFAEAICCATTISEWDAYWREASSALPAIPERVVVRRPMARQQWSVLPFFPPRTEQAATTLPQELGYQLFLRLCYDGPRVGLPHELGYDGKCDWCGVEVPIEVLFPDRDEEGTIVYDEEAIFTALTNVPWQGAENLQNLLDKVNQRSVFTPYRVPLPSKDMEFFRSLANMSEDIAPIEGWREIVNTVAENLQQFATSPYTDTELSIALQPLADCYTTPRDAILEQNSDAYKADRILFEYLGGTEDGYKGMTYDRIVKALAEEEPSVLIECLRTYFATPIRRVLSYFKRKSFQKIRSDFELAKEHVEQLNTMFERHSQFIDRFQDETAQVNVEKCERYLEQMSEFLSFVTELRKSRLPFGTLLLRILLKIFLLCPLADLVNPNVDVERPSGQDVDTTQNDANTILLIQLCLTKYVDERIAFNPVDVKTDLARSKEEEVNRFIDKFDKLSEDEKKLELMRKRLGLGDWSIGGTKLVYQYDKDQWLKNFTSYGRNVGVPPDMEGGAEGGVGLYAEGELGGVEDGGARDGDGYGDELGARADSDD